MVEHSSAEIDLDLYSRTEEAESPEEASEYHCQYDEYQRQTDVVKENVHRKGNERSVDLCHTRIQAVDHKSVELGNGELYVVDNYKCLIMGGFAQHFLPWVYNFVMDILSVYAAFADFLVVVFIVPILLYWFTKDRKYIYCALWMILSTVLQSVRTGMGGMVLVFTFAMYLRYKQRSLPGIIFAGAVFLGVILFVPCVNEKFFGDDAGTVTGEDIVQGNALSLDNIDMNGREYLWENAKKYCYKGNELKGKGLGSAEYFCKFLMYDDGRESKMHNDYIVLMCDTGNIGVGLLILFYAMVVIKVFAHVVLRKSAVLVKITGIMALSSMAGIAFCMYFDNVVSNSMQSMIIPYIFLGFFLKALDIEGKNKSTLAILRFRRERE